MYVVHYTLNGISNIQDDAVYVSYTVVCMHEMVPHDLDEVICNYT